LLFKNNRLNWLSSSLIQENYMQTVGAFDAKTHFSALLEKVEKGEQIMITKHGRAVAKLIPIEISESISRSDVINKIKAFRKKHKYSLTGLDWKTLRDEGRRY
jgi:prevent-host-death family protein